MKFCALRRSRLLLVFALATNPFKLTASAASLGARSGFVRMADGARIHYLEAGQQFASTGRPAMLFIPGWTMPAEIWEPQIRDFAKTHRVVAMDPRSQGESSKVPDGNYPEAHAQDIETVIRQLRLAPAILVGWSIGVDDLMAYVERYGCQKIAGLVLVDGHPWSWDYLDNSAAKHFLSPLFGFQQQRQQAAAAFVRSMYKHPQSAAYLYRITQASLLTPTNTALALIVGVVVKDRRAALAKINKPTLIVAAQRPDLRAIVAMHNQILNSRLVIMTGVGHALFADDPARFNSVLSSFLVNVERHPGPSR